MELEQFIRTIRIFGEEKTLVRPALTVNMFYAQPLGELGPFMADILQRYVAFIPDGSLTSYLSPSGIIKDLPPRVITKTLKALISIKQDAEFDEFHFGQGPDGAVGNYAISFIGQSLRDRQTFPSRANWLSLQFPIALFESVDPDRFIEFIVGLAKLVPFTCGIAGNGFGYVINGANDAKAARAIASMAMRLLAFDINYSGMRDFVFDRIYNVSWLNLWGSNIVASLGGRDVIQDELTGMQVTDVAQGILVRASERPPVGDIARSVDDTDPLKRLAKLTKILRPRVDLLGSEDNTFAKKWLSRFD